MAETVVMTCALNVRSETSRLFLAMRIWRELRAGPKPCSKCCVTLSASDELVEGLNWARLLLVSELLLVSPRLTSVPVSKFCCTPTVEVIWRWIRELVPVVNELLCGVVRCASPLVPVSKGSKEGGALPIWVDPARMNDCRPDDGPLPVTLEGPANTLVDTGEAKPPACARSRLASAICGPTCARSRLASAICGPKRCS